MKCYIKKWFYCSIFTTGLTFIKRSQTKVHYRNAQGQSRGQAEFNNLTLNAWNGSVSPTNCNYPYHSVSQIHTKVSLFLSRANSRYANRLLRVKSSNVQRRSTLLMEPTGILTGPCIVIIRLHDWPKERLCQRWTLITAAITLPLFVHILLGFSIQSNWTKAPHVKAINMPSENVLGPNGELNGPLVAH